LSFYHLVILSLGHFITWSFYHLVIYSLGHFITWSFYHLVILSLVHYVIWSYTWSFHHLVILLLGHYIIWSFTYQLIILSTVFSQLVVVAHFHNLINPFTKWLFINHAFCQLVVMWISHFICNNFVYRSFWVPVIPSTSHFVKYFFINWSFHQLTSIQFVICQLLILFNQSFLVNWSFSTRAFSSAGYFFNKSFHF